MLPLVKLKGIRSGLIFGGKVRQVALGSWFPLPVILQELAPLRAVSFPGLVSRVVWLGKRSIPYGLCPGGHNLFYSEEI
jgi:hypothetical protein